MEEFSRISRLRCGEKKGKKKEAFLRWDLSFLCDNLEYEYEKFLREKARAPLKIYWLSVTMLFLIALIFEADVRGLDYSHLLLGIPLAISAFFLIFSALIQRQKEMKHPQVLLIAAQLTSVVTYNEFFLQSQGDAAAQPQISLHSLIVLFLLVVPLKIQKNWKHCLKTSITLVIYLFFRLFSNENEGKKNLGLSISSCIWLVVIIVLTSYYNERWDRSFYYGRNLADESLEKFQHIIKKVIPCSTLIFKKGKIVFYSHETRRILNHRVGMKIEEMLKLITLSKYKHQLVDEGEINILEENYAVPSIDATYSMNLYEFLTRDYSNSNEEMEELNCGLVNFWGLYSEKQNSTTGDDLNSMNNDKIFEIKISNISWDGDEAKIIIISEDRVSQKIKYLNEQARYKDMLLATVSHDLRTPLNGVIGVLEMTLGLVSDELVRKK